MMLQNDTMYSSPVRIANKHLGAWVVVGGASHTEAVSLAR